MISLFGKKPAPTRVVDPSCGMKMDPATAAATREPDGAPFHFLSLLHT